MPTSRTLLAFAEYIWLPYRPIPQDSTEAEKLDSDLPHSSNGQHSPVCKRCRGLAFQRISGFIALLLILGLFILGISNLVISTRILRYRVTKENQPTMVYREVGNDLRYQSLHHQFDFLWDVDLSESNGIVVQPSKDGELQVGGISMFHQLHCLAYLRKTLQSAHAGKDIGMDWRDDDHWPHCFLYLRQTLLCYADDFIERPQVVNGTETHSINGMHDLRKCKNPQEVYDFRDEQSIKRFNLTEGHGHHS